MGLLSKKRQRDLRGRFAWLAITGILVGSICVSSAVTHADDARNGDPLVLVVSKSSALRNLSRWQVRSLFLDNRLKVNGKQYKPVALKAGSLVRARFDGVILGMTPKESAMHWTDLRVKGLGVGPKVVSSELKTQVTVYKATNAVGYIRLSQLHPDKINILTIAGKSYDSPEYLLR